MRLSKHGTERLPLVSLILVAVTATAAQAQTPVPAAGNDRLFLSFAEDATVIETQWWEGQLEALDADRGDAWIVRGVVALQPLEDIEIGVRVGFGDTDAPGTLPDGSGATDLDVWGKFSSDSGSRSRFAVGTVITVPTGDDTAGLGFDAFALELFGSLRYELRRVIVTGNLGVRLNEDGQTQGARLDGETSPFIAGGVIYPFSQEISAIGEIRAEAERFDGAETDSRVLGGINWRLGNRGQLRFAVSVGLTDGAPDSQLLAGYAHRF